MKNNRQQLSQMERDLRIQEIQTKIDRIAKILISLNRNLKDQYGPELERGIIKLNREQFALQYPKGALLS